MSGALVVFAKRPAPGQVKTRLTPPLHPEQAAELYREMLGDVLSASAGFAAELGLAAVLTVAPIDACADLARIAPPVFRVVPQHGADLAARMAWAAAEQAAAGCDRILLRGSDSPALSAATLADALAALERHDLVLCPDRDGGYNLVGLRRPIPGLFDHPMSTERVLDDTLAAARAQDLRVRVLEPGFDIDRFEDLRLLAAERAAGRAVLCPRTIAYLDAQRLWPDGDGA